MPDRTADLATERVLQIATARRAIQALYLDTPKAVADDIARVIAALIDGMLIPTAWRPDAPTTSGWYAFREGTRTVCVHVVAEAGGLWVELHHDDGEVMPLSDVGAGLWKGPLDFDAL